MNANLYALLQSGFPRQSEAVCLEPVEGRLLTYGDIERESARMKSLLVSLGVRRGDRVAVQVDKSPQAVLLYLACLRAGAVYLPLNVGYTPAELAYFLGDAEPRVLVCRPSAKPVLEPVAREAGVAEVLTLDAEGQGTLTDSCRTQEPDPDVADVAIDDLAAILYTSGTTGRSKGAMITHGNLSSNALALHRLWGFRPGDVLLHALPIFHVHGLFVALNTALLNGSRILFLPKFDAGHVIERLPQASVMMGVPTFYVRLLERRELTPELCRSMRLFVSGSAPLLAETHEAFFTRTGHRILERYGMTEAGMITSNPLDGERIAGTVGYPLPGIEVRVRGEDGNVLPPGGIGVLEVRGPNVFKGYWRMPEKTAEDFRPDGFFVTGDLATIAADGRVTIVGRAKDLIISGGYNVYPKEIENEIDRIEGIAESAVIGVPHPDFGEGVVAVVTRDGSAEISEDGVIGALKGRLARFKLPKRVLTVDALPRNTMGKVQKNQLRERFANLFKE